MPGSGKSSVAPLLAKVSAADCIDLDRRIEQAAGCPIKVLFARDGQPAFRAIEERLLRELLMPVASRSPSRPQPRVIALGGGALLDRGLRQHALRRAYVVVLHAPVEVLARRLAYPNERPLLAGDVPQRLRGLLHARADAYAEGHLQQDTAGRTATEVVAELAQRWRPRPG